MKSSLFWCDICLNEKINNKTDLIYLESGGWWQQTHYKKHLQNAKHLKNKEKVEKCDDSIKCKYCNKLFSVEGFKLHSERNKLLWTAKDGGGYKDIICNNFIAGKNRRFNNIQELSNYNNKNKPKSTRTKVGKFSPVTNSIRKPNINKNKTKEQRIQEKKDSDDEYYETCKKCEGAFNDTNYIDVDFVERFNTFLCECDDVVEEEKPKSEIYNIIRVAPELSIDELDLTERPTFDEYCGTCGLPENEDIPISIINKWEIDICDCE